MTPTELRAKAIQARHLGMPTLADALDAAADRIEGLERELDEAERLLLDAEDEALRHGSRWGLCDATDNGGKRYQSAWAQEIMQRARARRVDARAALREVGR